MPAQADRQENTMDHLLCLQTLGRRFSGITLEYRRAGTDWPAAWRVRLVSAKNEREEYRVEFFGETAQQAIEALQDYVEDIDMSHANAGSKWPSGVELQRHKDGGLVQHGNEVVTCVECQSMLIRGLYGECNQCGCYWLKNESLPPNAG